MADEGYSGIADCIHLNALGFYCMSKSIGTGIFHW